MKITHCKIGPYPRNWSEMLTVGLPKVQVTFEDGTEKELFSFYPNELSFRESEFVGLTEQEARDLRTNRDISYLRS